MEELYMKKFIKIVVAMAFMTIFMASPVWAADYTEGIDVSNYNNTVDWNQVKTQGKKFVMIKTGEGVDTGTDDFDEQFESNYAGAGAAGLKRGVYHMAYRTTVAEAKQEAQYCLKILKGRKLEYPVAYDIEYARVTNTGKTNVTNMAKAFCDVIKNAGYTPMIYANTSTLNTCIDWSKLSGVKVWVAEYGVDKPSFTGTYCMWQYSQTGMVSGANTDNGVCDLNQSYLDAVKIKLSAGSKSLGIKQSYTLKAAVTPSTAWDPVTYSSSSKTVATVSAKGVIKALKAGKTVITVKAGAVSAKCTVTVKKAPSNVTLSRKTLTLKRGKSYTIKPRIPSGSYSYKYTYSSNKKSVATVSSKGVVKAVKKGTAYITVKTFNGKTAKLKVSVK